MITIVDYGAGNLRSVANAFDAIGCKTRVTRDPDDLATASAIVLPGVGAFGDGIDALRGLGLVEALREEVVERGKPYLGICLGLQFLADESEEHGRQVGLGWLKGAVRRIEPADPTYRVPHIGWNPLRIDGDDPLLADLGASPVMYFVHSYHFVPDAGSRGAVTSTCSHGETIVASVHRDNIHAVQFHPEKSQGAGLKLLENFVERIAKA
jgi:glutamine amidotransferase